MRFFPSGQSLDAGFDDLGYAHTVNGNSHVNVCERAIWCAVLEQSLLDMRSTNPQLRRQKHEATHFLLKDRKDFLLVCEMAGVDASAIRRGAELIAQGVIVMADDGRGRRGIRVQ